MSDSNSSGSGKTQPGQLGHGKTAKLVKPAAEPKKTKHGQEVVRLLRELGKFEWDEQAMKRV